MNIAHLDLSVLCNLFSMQTSNPMKQYKTLLDWPITGLLSIVQGVLDGL